MKKTKLAVALAMLLILVTSVTAQSQGDLPWSLVDQIGDFLPFGVGGISAGLGVLVLGYALFYHKPKYSRNRRMRRKRFRDAQKIKNIMLIVSAFLIFVGANAEIDNWFTGGGFDSDPTTPFAINYDLLATQTTFSSVTSGSDEIEHNVGKYYEYVITSSDLNSANETTWTATGTTVRTDSLVAWDGTDANLVVKYDCKAFSFKDKVDTSDATTYYTVDFDSSEKYNVTVDSVAYKSLPASDTVSHATDGSWVIAAQVEDYTTLDKCVKNNFEKCKVLECSVLETGDRIVLNYMKD